MHTSGASRSESNYFYKCSKPNCHASFRTERAREIHLRAHNNDFDKCQYCPFKYIVPGDYRNHLNRHFGIKDFKCDQCGKLFISKVFLNKHYPMHEGIIYHCLLCEAYNASLKNVMHTHLSKKHSEVVGKYFTWESVEKFVKITK